MKLLMDCLGGDHSPEANVEGALLAMADHPELSMVLVGDRPKLEALLGERRHDPRLELVHAPACITGEDRPTDAIRHKKDSSMIRAVELLREDERLSGLVSTGATGALVAAATLRIGRIRGIRRPAFCPILPTMDGRVVGICDSGANVDILPEQLVQFAILGGRYLECEYGIEAPRVALLNIGTETEKGDALRKTAYPLLEKAPCVNFVGNMESRDLLTGRYDLVVCDGFAGNVLLKTTEGTAMELMKKIKRDIGKRTRYKLGALLMKRMFLEEKDFMNYQRYGGSVLLGLNKTVVKGHGSSSPQAVKICVEQAIRMEKNSLNDKIRASLEALEPDAGKRDPC